MKSTLLFAVPCVLLLGDGSLRAQEDLNTQLMNATFKLGNTKSTGTAFLLSRPAAGDPRKTQFLLVTAAHVFDQMVGDEAVLFFRRQEGEGVYQKVPTKVVIRRGGKVLWTRHPAADVAVLPVVPPDAAAVPRLPLDLLATDDAMKKWAVHPGDPVMTLGYPHRMEANGAGFPVLRSGPIASFPLVPARTTRTMLLSMNTFEGDSGGPVYLAEPRRRAAGNKEPEEVRLIVGLVVGQHFLDEEAKLIYGASKVRHRLGLAIAVPAVFIRETIDRLPRAP